MNKSKKVSSSLEELIQDSGGSVDEQDESETLEKNSVDTHAGFNGYVERTADKFISRSEDDHKAFNELLDTLATTEEKQKALWRQIYENSTTDRLNAYVIWVELYSHVKDKPMEHAIHGQNLSKYLERMSKANDQLIKLSELVGNAKKKDSPTEYSEDALYDMMENKGKH